MAVFFLGDLLKNTGRFIGSLILLKKGNEPKRVHGHNFVHLHELKLMCLGLCEEDLLALLLRRGQLHYLTDVATVEVAEKLYSTPHELVHWHEDGLLSGTKPADQLVANVGEPGDCLKVIPGALVKVHLRTVCFGGALLGDNARPFS